MILSHGDHPRVSPEARRTAAESEHADTEHITEGAKKNKETNTDFPQSWRKSPSITPQSAN
jgi:hypothetical protein